MFTDTPLAGNGLAVVHDAADVSEEVMLAFARETRLVETTFVQPPTVEGADYRNRIWTPAEEIPFAGHPSLGTAVAAPEHLGQPTVEHPAPAGSTPDGEDVLEETPEFLQETPEHDRLWFEQKPPRDFDLDR